MTYTDVMLLLGILVGAGLVVGVVVAGLVYLDCARRGRPATSRLVQSLAYGGGSFAGFLVPYVFRQGLLDVYYEGLKPQPIVSSPAETLAVSLVIGLAIAAVIVGLYLAGRRFQNRPVTKP